MQAQGLLQNRNRFAFMPFCWGALYLSSEARMILIIH